MAALDFPNSPTVGQVATLTNGFSYQWDGAVWVLLTASTGQVAGGVLAGTYPNPTFAANSSYPLAPIGQLAAGGGAAGIVDLRANVNGDPGYDNTKPQWLARLQYGAGDQFMVQRGPAGGGATTILLGLDNTGKLTLTGYAQHKCMAGGVTSSTTQSLPNNALTVLTMPAVNNDSSGGVIPVTASSQVKAPAAGWISVTGHVYLSANLTGGAAYLQCETSPDGSTGWITVASAQMVQAAFGNNINVAFMRPAGAPWFYRLSFYNGSGSALTSNAAYLWLLYHGTM